MISRKALAEDQCYGLPQFLQSVSVLTVGVTENVQKSCCDHSPSEILMDQKRLQR